MQQNITYEPSSTYSEKPSNQRLRLAYLDGIRGLAALYVVLVHCWEPSLAEALQPALLWLPIAKFLRYGIFAVVVFIVLSGYCLMLPVVRSDKKYLSGGLLGFFKRRIRRILPPYYAALILCSLIGVFVLWIEQTANLGWDEERLSNLKGLFSPSFSFKDILCYLLLIQNFGSSYINKINGPTWTVAVEWQIYFVFAIFLIPIWRRLGLLPTLTIAFVVGITLNYLMGELSSTVHPWFLGLFALGMAAAEINFSQKPFLVKMKKSLPWDKLAAVFTCFGFLTEWIRFNLIQDMPEWVIHYFIAFGAACFLIYCTNFFINGKPLPPAVRFLESPRIVGLGVFSYSLYIIHAPIVWLVFQILLSMHLSPSMLAVKWFVIGVPLSILVAYVFYRFCERPFMSHLPVKVKSQM
ncbi:MAG: acyltransferase [Brasilonema octagenarum HA4186-MV1]|jgi:peptidoglycan/LPS O-acetylase OafA/YrhL|nr:acyltransferase [Brasilonema octagenarum HA4186-MV1]